LNRHLSTRLLSFLTLAGSLVIGSAAPLLAKDPIQTPLFDTFNFRIEASWADLSTEIRIDSELLGTGTKLNFEDDLDLDAKKVIPSFQFEWQIAEHHRLGVRWQDIDRSSSAQALTEIHWGDDVIPIDADISLGYDISQVFIDYTYYPWVHETWAAGLGIGVRWMRIEAALRWQDEGNQIDTTSEAKGSGPLPYIYGEYRTVLAENWRLIAGLGWLSVTVGDIDGSQIVAHASIEYLLGERWSFGAQLNLSAIDVDWNGLENEEGQPIYTGALTMDIDDFSVFARVRF